MQLPARMPRASLNPSVPPPSTATSATSAVAGGPPMTQPVSRPCLSLMSGPQPMERSPWFCPITGAAASHDVIALASADVTVHAAAAAAFPAAPRLPAQLGKVRFPPPGCVGRRGHLSGRGFSSPHLLNLCVLPRAALVPHRHLGASSQAPPPSRPRARPTPGRFQTTASRLQDPSTLQVLSADR